MRPVSMLANNLLQSGRPKCRLSSSSTSLCFSACHPGRLHRLQAGYPSSAAPTPAMEPCPPQPGCQHCLGCLPCALTYELCDRTRCAAHESGGE